MYQSICQAGRSLSADGARPGARPRTIRVRSLRRHQRAPTRSALADTLGFHSDVASREPEIHPAGKSAERSRKPNRQRDAASRTVWLDRVVGFRHDAGSPAHPRESALLLETRDLPHRRPHARLAHAGLAPDGEWAVVEPRDLPHRGRPVRPVLHILHHRPHIVRRRIDIDGDDDRLQHRSTSMQIPLWNE